MNFNIIILDPQINQYGEVNQLGGVFVNGRPLPNHIRVRIIEGKLEKELGSLPFAQLEILMDKQTSTLQKRTAFKVLKRYFRSGKTSDKSQFWLNIHVL